MSTGGIYQQIQSSACAIDIKIILDVSAFQHRSVSHKAVLVHLLRQTEMCMIYVSA